MQMWGGQELSEGQLSNQPNYKFSHIIPLFGANINFENPATTRTELCSAVLVTTPHSDITEC